MNRAISIQLIQASNRLNAAKISHSHFHPLPILQQKQTLVAQLGTRLSRQMQQNLADKKRSLQQWMNLLNTVSPLNTLERGYSITRQENGSVIRNVNALKKGDLISTKLAEGEFQSRVESLSTKLSSQK